MNCETCENEGTNNCRAENCIDMDSSKLANELKIARLKIAELEGEILILKAKVEFMKDRIKGV